MLSVRLTHKFASGLGLNMALETSGPVTSILGPSGSGKTTLAHAIAGLFRPDIAHITWAGRTFNDSGKGHFVRPSDRGFGVVFQNARLLPHLSVADNIIYGRRARSLPNDPKGFAETVDAFNLQGLLDRRPGTLSGGEKQRVALARALCSSPGALVLDEPLSALDPGHRGKILSVLETLKLTAPVPTLHITHDLDEAARLADSLVILENGQCKASGPVAEVLSDLQAASLLEARRVGSILVGQVSSQGRDGLARINLGQDHITLSAPDTKVGDQVRLRILAQNVVLGVGKPGRLSVQNTLNARVEEVKQTTSSDVLVRLLIGEQPLLAQITNRALQALDLRPGADCLAMTKTVSVYPGSVGPATPSWKI